MLPRLDALTFESIGGTAKRNIHGELASTRLGLAVTDRWANERFRTVMLLVRAFRTEWPTLINSDDVEFIRVAVDTALVNAIAEGHAGCIYDLNATTWAIWLVQHAKCIRIGQWAVESLDTQTNMKFETLYHFLGVQHARGDVWNVYDPVTRELRHRYRLPFKANMRVPPKPTELFKWRKGARQLSNWMVAGGLPPFDEALGVLEPPALIAPLNLETARESQRASMWSRIARGARSRGLISVTGTSDEATHTRGVVGAIMSESRAGVLAPAEIDELDRELEAQLDVEPGSEVPPEERHGIKNDDLDAVLAFLMS